MEGNTICLFVPGNVCYPEGILSFCNEKGNKRVTWCVFFFLRATPKNKRKRQSRGIGRFQSDVLMTVM